MMTSRKQSILAQFAIVALILLTMVVYMPPFIRSFVGDDYIQFDYVKQFWLNPASISGVFNPTAVPWYYRPTQNIWFWLNRLILGWEPFGYYIILLWFHALVIALVYRVARQFGLGLFAAFVTAVLMAIHSHWVDVVTWISSVAIVMGAIFSLLAVSALLGYLRRPSIRQMGLVVLLTLVTFLTHEEAILLPPLLLILLLMWRWQAQKLGINIRKPKKRKRTSQQSLIPQLKAANLQSLLSKQELITFALLFAILLGYLLLQFTRPNPTVQVSERSLAEWLAFLRWSQVAEFVLVTFFRFTFLAGVLSLSGWAASAFTVGLIFLLGVWFWQGNWVVRFGLIWLLAHLFFIYWALWSQLPTLYAGRHIYQGGIGLALAIGATVEIVISNWVIGNFKMGRWQLPITQLLILGLLTAVTIHHIRQTSITQQAWLANVTEEETAKAQLFELFPEISDDDHLFSFRFPIIPDFTRAVAQVWYEVPLARPGGSIKHLSAHGRADPSFIVLDYDAGQVYDLMPDLRDYAETLFLWENGANMPDVTVVAAPNGRQLTVSQPAAPADWNSLTYRVNVPQNAVLRTAVLAQPNISYRLQIGEETVFAQMPLAAGAEAEWVEVSIPLQDVAGQQLEIRLQATAVAETEANAYWANPRFVIE